MITSCKINDTPLQEASVFKDFSADVQCYHGEVMLSAKTDNGRNLDNFFKLGHLMMEEEIKFIYETESFVLEVEDFEKLCKIIMGCCG